MTFTRVPPASFALGACVYISHDEPHHDLDFAVQHALDAFRSFTDKPYFIPEFGVTDAEGDSRASRMRTLFHDELPAYPDIRAWAFADAPLFAAYFDITRMIDSPEEIAVWQEEVWNSGLYTNVIRMSNTVPGDLDGDGDVDQQDLGLLLAAYLSGNDGDIDGDGDTDQSDLGLLLANFGGG